MCYHIKPPKSMEKAATAFDARLAAEVPLIFDDRFYNGFEHPDMPVILDESPQHIITATWGLIPHWAVNQEPKAFYAKTNTLNARIEEIEQKASYKSYTNNRCLVLAQSFKEWKHLGGTGKKVVKEPYEVSMPDDSLFAMAGIYAINSGRISFSVLMTEANELMAEIHNSAKRMPVVLNADERRLWLNRDRLESYHNRTEVELKAQPLTEPGFTQSLF